MKHHRKSRRMGHHRRRRPSFRPKRNPVVRVVERTPDWMASLSTFHYWLEDREWVKLPRSRSLHVQHGGIRGRRTYCGLTIHKLKHKKHWFTAGGEWLDLHDPMGDEPRCRGCTKELRKQYKSWAIVELGRMAKRLGLNVEVTARRNS